MNCCLVLENAIKTESNNGVIEGIINKIKVIKLIDNVRQIFL